MIFIFVINGLRNLIVIRRVDTGNAMDAAVHPLPNSYNNPCVCDDVGNRRVWVTCMWCTTPHHSGRPRRQAQWCRCQCHWLITSGATEDPNNGTLGICWGCMAEFISGPYSDVYRLEKIYRLLDRTTTLRRRHIERVVYRSTTVEQRRPDRSWANEDPGIGNSSTTAAMQIGSDHQIQVHITEWWRRVHAIRALNDPQRVLDRSPEGAADHRWLEWSVHPPNNDAMLIVRRGFRAQRHTWDWDNPNEYIDLNRELSLIPSPVSGTPDSQTEDDDLANEANVMHEVD